MIRSVLCTIAVLLLGVSVVTKVDAAESDAAEPDIKAYAAAVARAYADLQRGDTKSAQSALDGTEPSLRGTVDVLLRHLARQKDSRQAAAGNAIPKPDTQFALSILNPTKPVVVYVCDLGVALVYDLDRLEQEPKRVVSTRQKPLVHGGFSADGAFFAAGDTEGGVTVWDARSWTETASYEQGTTAVRNVTLNHDGSRLLAETQQGVVLWDTSSGQQIGIVSPRYNFGTALGFSGDQRHFATGGLFSIAILDVATGKPVREIKHAPYTMHVCFSPDGQRIASGLRGSRNNWLGVFDVTTGETVFDGARHEKGITGLLSLDDGKCLLSTSADGVIKFWHVPSGTELLAMKMGDSIYQPSMTTDGNVLLWNQRSGPRYFRIK